MHSFYSPDFNSSSQSLPEEEARHAVKSLRVKQGTTIELLNGQGQVFTAIVSRISNHGLDFEITQEKTLEKKKPLLHVAISPVKSTDRFEWFLEKATELGIESITPIICKRTERNKLKASRLKKIIVSAMKQSGNPYLPYLNEVVEFEDFLKSNHPGIKLLAHCEEAQKTELRDVQFTDTVTILIGPEGDFTREEIVSAVNSGFTPVSFGDTVLRTETAGLAICAYLRLKFH